jgi:hypothetical protein
MALLKEEDPSVDSEAAAIIEAGKLYREAAIVVGKCTQYTVAYVAMQLFGKHADANGEAAKAKLKESLAGTLATLDAAIKKYSEGRI